MRHLIPALALGALILANPICAAQESAGANSEAAQTYELRGFFGTPANLEVSVRKPGSDNSQWVRVGEKTDGMLVEKADAKAGTATLRAGGATYNLRLMGQSAPTAAATPAAPVAEPKKEAPKPSNMDPKRREELAKRATAFFDSLSEEQNTAMMAAVGGKMEALEKSHPEWKDGPPKDPETIEAAIREIIPIMREGLEAAAKLPCKDGKPLVVPDDLEDMLRAGLKTEVENASKHKAAQEAAK